MKLPRIQTKFAIDLGPCDPQGCTDFIDLRPHRITTPTVKGFSPTWEIEVTECPLYSLDDGLRRVIGIIWPYREKIAKFCADYQRTCQFVSNVTIDDDSRPVFDISSETIGMMVSFKASWIMDLF
jgi:Domain of unknown function (DUF4279)